MGAMRPSRRPMRAKTLWVVVAAVVLPLGLLIASYQRTERSIDERLVQIRGSMVELRREVAETELRLHGDFLANVTERMQRDARAHAVAIEAKFAGFERHVRSLVADASIAALFRARIAGADAELAAAHEGVERRLAGLRTELGVVELRVLDDRGREIVRCVDDVVVDSTGARAPLRNATDDESGSTWFGDLARATAQGAASFVATFANVDFAADAAHRDYPGVRSTWIVGAPLHFDESGRLDGANGSVRGYVAMTIDARPDLESVRGLLFDGWHGDLVDVEGRSLGGGVSSSRPPHAGPHVEHMVRGPSGEAVCSVRLTSWHGLLDAAVGRLRQLTGSVDDRSKRVADGWWALQDDFRVASEANVWWAVLLAAAATVVAWWIGRRTSTRVQRLARAAEHLSRGEPFDFDPRDDGDDDVGQLAARFRAMSAALVEREEQLQRHLHDVERLVEERTVALTEQTRTLEHTVAEAQRRRIEAERANDAARAASQAKSEFLANTSHEIRTPMNGILGLLQLIEARPVDEETGRLTRDARACAESLLAILNDILDFSKIEAGKMVLERLRFDPRSLFEGPVALVLASGRAKGLTTTLEIPPSLPEELVGDPVRLRQIVHNLVANAVKFTEAGSVCVKVSGEKHGQKGLRLWIEVRDTGIGIKRERQAAIWGSFAQEDGSATRRYGGSGLGLAITRRLVDLMGGEIGVQSAAGEGSTFWFVVPMEIGPGPAAEADAAETSPDATVAARRVLLVEDNPINRTVATKMLERIGCDVTVAEDGRRAVDLCASSPFDLILMDVQMPVMDGLSATRAIRTAEGAARRVPIVALTANAMDQDREECRAAGMDGFLAKPYRAQDLVTAVAQFLTPANAGD